MGVIDELFKIIDNSLITCIGSEAFSLFNKIDSKEVIAALKNGDTALLVKLVAISGRLCDVCFNKVYLDSEFRKILINLKKRRISINWEVILKEARYAHDVVLSDISFETISKRKEVRKLQKGIKELQEKIKKIEEQEIIQLRNGIEQIYEKIKKIEEQEIIRLKKLIVE